MGHPALKGRRGGHGPGNENVFRALIAGGIAALVGGGIWATIVRLTNFEVGYVAWGVGLLVGLAMAWATPSRDHAMGILAVLLAALGLGVGKALIVYFAMQPASLAGEIMDDREWMAQAAAYDLDQRQAFPQSVQQQLAALSFSDTLPDAVWEDMLTAGAEYATNAEPDERERIASAYSMALTSGLPFTQTLFSSLGLFDLLWFGLAITTAWKIMTSKPEQQAVVVEETPQQTAMAG